MTAYVSCHLINAISLLNLCYLIHGTAEKYRIINIIKQWHIL
jgi:hypothetical protein